MGNASVNARKKLLTIVGARPQFIKAAVVSRLIHQSEWSENFQEILVHTGQHFDDNMSEVFFREMCIPVPDVNLGIGGGSHGNMTGTMLGAIETVILAQQPDLVLVYGDTNSTLATVLAAAKLQVPVAHVEAGLRSFDKRMPEEQNRIVVDHLSSWLLCPTTIAVDNLEHEGIVHSRKGGAGSKGFSCNEPCVALTGDVMYDASLYYRNLAAQRPAAARALRRLGLRPGDFILMTLHRAENTDNPDRLRAIFAGLATTTGLQLLLPLHPRTRKALSTFRINLPDCIKVVEPLGFLDMVELEENCAAILTDSGGVQKEAFFFGKPCITFRDNTEWVETIDSGWNRLVGANPELIKTALMNLVPGSDRPDFYGDGDAGQRILEILRA
jgi:UDP-GlcNAc3NAcA epimerase